MTELPPLYRAAMETSLEDHGVEHPRVSKDGQVTEQLPDEDERTPLYDPDGVFVVQAVVEADVMVGLLTGETFARGETVLQHLGVDDAHVLYEKRREIAVSHGISSVVLKDTLLRARNMIGGARRTIKSASRS